MPRTSTAYRATPAYRLWTLCAALAAMSIALISPPAAAQDGPSQPKGVDDPGKVPYVPALLQEQRVAIEEALSTERALRHIERFGRYHRLAPSPGLDRAMHYVERELKAAGIGDVETLTYTSNGKKVWWIEPAPPAWTCEAAELWLEAPNEQKIGDWSTDPIRVAAYSTSCDLTADVVEVTDWNKDDLDVRGKLVLTSGDPRALNAKAREAGAVGLLIAPPEKASTEALRDAVHASSLSPAVEDWPTNLFAFNLSENEANSIRFWIEQGKPVRAKAVIKNARTAPAKGTIVSGQIRTSGRTGETVLLIAEVAGPRPGANAASGAAALLSLARSYRELLDSGALPPPSRNIRFLFVPNLHGACAYARMRPDVLDNVVAVVHLGIVGTDTEDGPAKGRALQLDDGGWIVPSFVPYLALNIGRYVGESEMVDIAGSAAPINIGVHSRGLVGAQSLFYSGSLPRQMVSISFFPDAVTATSLDTADRLDPTSLKRTMYIAVGTVLVCATEQQREIQRFGPLISSYMVRDLAGSVMCFQWLVAKTRADRLQPVYYRISNVMTRNMGRHINTTMSLGVLVPIEIRDKVRMLGADAKESYGQLAVDVKGIFDARTLQEKLNLTPLRELLEREVELLDKVPSMVWYGPVTEQVLRRRAPQVLPVPRGVNVQILFSFIDGRRELLNVWGEHEAIKWIGLPIPPPIEQLTPPPVADLEETVAFLERAEQAGIIRISPKKPAKPAE